LGMRSLAGFSTVADKGSGYGIDMVDEPFIKVRRFLRLFVRLGKKRPTRGLHGMRQSMPVKGDPRVPGV
jgi:hypothetical protein